MNTPAATLSLAQQVMAARAGALVDLPHLQIRPQSGLPCRWRAVYCCQTLYVASEQSPEDQLQAVLDGVANMVDHSDRADTACEPRDELADRRVRINC